MPAIEGFELTELLYRSDRSAVYRGRRVSDGLPVVLKCLEAGASAEDWAYLRYAHELLNDLTVEGVPVVVDLATYEGRPALVMKDIGGRSVDQILKTRPFDARETLRLAISVARILGRLHQHDVIHQDIRPSNIVLNESTGEVQLVDFQLASRLLSETPNANQVGMFRGSLAFVAPERTGRTNHAVDHRSDLYAFGATLFYLLTGRPPFDVADPLAMIHSHVAVVPRAPSDVDPSVPKSLSPLVLKLLSKSPSERYQSAYGVEADLRRCLAALDEVPAVDAPIELGRDDISSRFLIPDKLYGREHHLQTLLAAVEETANRRTGLVLVAGPAGIGKSELVNAVRAEVAGTRGMFLSGKFDQLQNVPYAAILQCLHEFVHEVQTESGEDITEWRHEISAAIGSVGGVLVERVPPLERIIGPQPPVPDLSPAEAYNRLVLALVSLLNVITRRRNRLVMFLDDLQWAGSNSIRLLQDVLTSGEIRGLLVIGAYRDSDVDQAHPIRLLPGHLTKAEVPVNEFALVPLPLEAVQQLVADTVSATPGHVAPLASVVFAKTKGDPFFVKRFLRAAYAADAIAFDGDAGRWAWDLGRVERMAPTDNVAHLIAEKLRELPPRTREVLNLAACLGGRFTLAALARVGGIRAPDVARVLKPALQDDVLMPMGGNWRVAEHLADADDGEAVGYSFSHDRVRLAAYELFPPEHRHRHHLDIGRMSLDEIGSNDDALFECVNQLNSGREALHEAQERLRLCELNLKAGTRARDVGAFSDGFSYIDTGLGLLPDTAWTTHLEIALQLHLAGAELAYLVADHAAMDRLITSANHVAAPTVKAALARIRVSAALGRGEPAAAVAEALDGLTTLGIHIPSRPSRLYLLVEFAKARFALRGQRDEELLNLPAASDPRVLAAMNIFGEAWAATYIAQPELFPAFILKMVQLAVKHGKSPVSSLTFANYALLLNIAFGDTRAARRFGALAMRLADDPMCRRYRPKTRFVVYDFLQHWYEPVKNTVEPVYGLHQEAREAGDFDTAAVTPVVGVNAMSYAGVPLPEIATRAARYVDAVRREQTLFYMLELGRQRVLNLMGRAAGDPWVLKGETAFDESKVLSTLEAGRAGTTLCGYHLIKSHLAFLLQQYEMARHHADLAVPLLSNLAGDYSEVLFQYYDALAYLQSVPRAGLRRSQVLRRVRRRLARLHRAARHAPMNFGHLAAIVAAELAAATGRELEAANGYDVAIAQAKVNGFLADEAVATELAGRFHLRRGRREIGKAYLRAAYAQFARWGGIAKLDVLRAEFPWIATPTDAHGTSWSRVTQLDARSVLKAAEAISSEIVLDDLVKTLMATVVESAGADRAALFLREGDELELVARFVGVGAPLELGPRQKIGQTQGVARSIVRYVERTSEAVVIDDASRHGRFGDDPHFASSDARSVLCLPIMHQNRSVGILYLENTLTTEAFSLERVGLLQALSGQMAISLDNARLYNRLQQSLDLQVQLTTAQSRFISTQFLHALGRENIVTVGTGDHVEKELSILFSDVRGFTTLSEEMTPAETIEFINSYLERMEPPILKCGGFIDTYIGDAIMALFDTDADRAVAAALDMLEALQRLNDERQQRGRPAVRTGIGIHTGPVMLGTIGGRNHLKCSVIGDAVNVASRVEGLTKRYDRPLLVTESTRDRLTGPLRARTRIVDRVRVAGRQTAVNIFEVMERTVPWAGDALNQLALFEQAACRYYEAKTTADVTTSLALFERYAGLVPGDPLPAMYIVRCQRQIASGLSPDLGGEKREVTAT